MKLVCIALLQLIGLFDITIEHYDYFLTDIAELKLLASHLMRQNKLCSKFVNILFKSITSFSLIQENKVEALSIGNDLIAFN